jgi:hypothetical protein
LTRLIYNTVALIPLRLIAQLRRTTTATSDRAAQQQVYWSSLFIYFGCAAQQQQQATARHNDRLACPFHFLLFVLSPAL